MHYLLVYYRLEGTILSGSLNQDPDNAVLQSEYNSFFKMSLLQKLRELTGGLTVDIPFQKRFNRAMF